MVAIFVDDAAVAVRGVLAEADVGDEDEGVEGAGGLEGAQTLLDDAVGRVGAGGLLVLFCGQTKEEQAAEAERGAGFSLLDGFIYRQIEDAGHGADLFAYAFSGAEKEWINERAGMQMRLADKGAQSRSTTQTAQTRGWKVHASSLRRTGIHRTASNTFG